MPSNNSPGPSPSNHGIISEEVDQIIVTLYASVMALALVVTHLIVVTKFRLWHTNSILATIPKVVQSPISQILTQSVGLIAVIPYKNDLYLIWLVILLIAYDNVFTISSYTLLEKGSARISREYLFLTNCVSIGSLVIADRSEKTSGFYRPLLALWSLIVLKFIVRLISYGVAEKAYGIKNTRLVADYMETEHMLSDHTDPLSMKGYKYLVIGEEKVRADVKPPSYAIEFTKKTDRVVTVERVWECEKGLLNPTIDKDERIKDTCLSFALFKLIRRRFFGFRAAESLRAELKTKKLVFEGLLSHGRERAFRVINTELGFLRDFFYTRYPVTFAFGFPLFNIAILIAMLVISLWIAEKAFVDTKAKAKAKANPDFDYLMINNKKNIDQYVTNGLLITIMVMEIVEVLTEVCSDWMKVIIITGRVRSNTETTSTINKILDLVCKANFTISLNNTIRQYSLLENSNTNIFQRLKINSLCLMMEPLIPFDTSEFMSEMPPWMLQDKAIVLPVEVEKAVFNALKETDGNFADRLAPLRRNGVSEDLSWSVENQRTPMQTIMIWHIATSLCGIRPRKDQPIIDDVNFLVTLFTLFFQPFTIFYQTFIEKHKSTPDEESLEFHLLVASSLSKYCAYLVAFAPELLPTGSYNSKSIFGQIVLETSKFFAKANNSKARYKKMMEYSAKEGDDLIVHMGVRLGKYLNEQIPDDTNRWKVMSDVWSELILFVAPYGYTSGHLAKLVNGGEFITHLWALLYHAGIVANDSEDSFYPFP